MNEALALLDRALALARQEEEAVRSDDAEAIEQLVAERETLLEQVWEARHACDPDLFLARFTELKTRHEALMGRCMDEIARLRESIGGARRVARYMDAPKARLQDFNRSLLFNKTS